MAETEIEAFNALRRLLLATSTEAVAAADDAAAEVYLEAARASAPVGSGSNPKHPAGQLKASVRIIKSSKSKLLSSLEGNVAPRVFVGPEKKTGYYGYFVEKGWTATGSKRSARKATAKTHSQSGVSGGRKIAGRPWFEPAIQAAESRAIEAAQNAFNAKLAEIDSGA